MENLLNSFECFTVKNENYLYVAEKVKAYKIDTELLDELKTLKPNSAIVPCNLPPVFNEITEKLGLLKNSKKKSPPNTYPVNNITLNVAQLCNLNCVYCYGGEGDYGEKGLMPENVAFDSVDWLFNHCGNNKTLSITFFGGEPLLNFPLIKKVVTYAKTKAKQSGKIIMFSITTNGTLFTSEINEYLNNEKFSVVVSFDGDKIIQDSNRPFRNGEGSYDIALPLVKEFLVSRNGNATARATITGNNVNIAEIKENLFKLGFRKAQATIVSKPVLKKENKEFGYLVDPDQETILAEIDKEAESLELAISNKDISKFRNSMILHFMKQLQRKDKKYFSCGMGRAMASISISGKIYPCHRFVGLDDFQMGTIYEDTSKIRGQYLKNVFVDSNQTCGVCWAKYFCAGACYMDNFSETGNAFIPNNKVCEQVKLKLKHAIHIYSNLSISERIYINKFN